MPFFRQPLLHFLLIGTMLFSIQQHLGKSDLFNIPPRNTGSLQRINDDFLMQTGRIANAEELRALQTEELNSRILFAEALRLNLHRSDSVVLQRLLRDANFLRLTGSDKEKIQAALDLGIHASDEVIRRYLVQRVKRSGIATNYVEATEDQLRSLYIAELARWTEPARLSFEHIFFSTESNANPRGKAVHALRELESQNYIPSDPFLHGRRFPEQSAQDIQTTFGTDFSNKIMTNKSAIGKWQGPIHSVYGEHLVKVYRATPSKPRRFEDVREQVSQTLREQRENDALEKYIATLRKYYVIAGDGK